MKREKEGRNNLYTPLVRREDYLSAESRAFLQRLHGGSLPSLVAALMAILLNLILPKEPSANG